MDRLQINLEKGWHEAIIDDNCGFEKFYSASGILQQHFGIHFIRKLDDFDTVYWDFETDSTLLTLYYNIYFGLSVFPTKFQNASEIENSKAVEIGQLLFEKLKILNKNQKL